MSRPARLVMIVKRTLPAALLAVSAACGGDPVQPPPPRPLTIEYHGRAERGIVVDFIATRDDVDVSADAAWTADPADAIEWTAPGLGELARTGPVTVTARLDGAEAATQLDVAMPPSIVVERVVDGQRDIFRVALDGGDLTRLTEHPAEDRWPSVAANEVYFVSYRGEQPGVYAVPATGGTAAAVTSVAGDYRDAAISPDGSRIAFIASVDGIGKLFVSDRSGANAQRVAPASGDLAIELAPAWSRDGSRIAFVSTASGNADIVIAPSSGGSPEVVTTQTGADVEPAWSPDGRRIVLTRGDSDGSDLFTIDLASGEQHQLTTTGNAARATWLTDGRIVFSASDDGISKLYWLDPEQPEAIFRVMEEGVAGRAVEIR